METPQPTQPQQPTHPSQTPLVEPVKPPMPKSMVLPIAMVGVVVLLIAAAFLVGKNYSSMFATVPSPTPVPVVESSPTAAPGDETAGWERYTNTRSNFQIKYPNNWTGKSLNPGPPESDPDPSSYGFKLFPNGYNSAPEARNYINIETDGTWNLAHENYEDWLNHLTTKPYYTVQNVTSGKLNQIDATVVTGSYDGYGYPASIRSYLFSSKDKQTYYYVSVVTETSNSYEKEIDQILSTFEFVDGESAMEGWETYTTKDGKYSIMYPPDWTVEDKSTSVDLYGDGNEQYSQRLTISKDGYSFNSINPLVWGPTVCQYPDSPPFDGPTQQYGDYVEMKVGDMLYRRPIPPGTSNLFTICSKKANSDDLFGSVAGFGTAWYEIPSDYDTAHFDTLDKIFISLKAIN